ncbi:MAG: hypothetical protein ACUVX9_06030 [Anaerolineae bacterium]
MGVEFHWRSGDSEVEQRLPQRRPWAQRLVATSLGLALFVGIVLWLRGQGLRALQRDLQASVDAQVLALQTGQCDAFLECLDASYGPWLRFHRQAFARQSLWFAQQPHLRAEVVAVALEGDHALARVRRQPGGDVLYTWYFRRRTGIWRHGPPPPDGAAPVRITVGQMALLCQGRDAAMVHQQAPDLERFVGELTQTLGLPSRPTANLELRILPYGAASSDDTLPSPLMGLELFSEAALRRAAGRELSLAVTRQLIARLGGGGRVVSARDRWLRDALACWFAQYWEPSWQTYVAQAIAKGAGSRWLAGATHPPPAALYWEQRSRAAEPLWIEPLAYTLGNYLARNLPAQDLARLLEEDATHGPSAAIQAVLGISAGALQQAWLDDLRQRFATSGGLIESGH